MYIPMDETLARVVVDISGRPYLSFNASLSKEKVGTFDTELVEEFLAVVINAPFRPESLSLDAWLMFAIFVGTIIGCIHTTYADWCRIDHRFTLTVLVGVIDTKTAVQGFGNPYLVDCNGILYL